jgi:hypothetical protein
MKGQELKNEPMAMDVKDQMMNSHIKREPGENNEHLSEEALAE